MHTEPTAQSDHSLCSVHDPCDTGVPAACPREPARRARAELKHGAWSALELRRELGGLRHYLDGRPVHCGAALELQHTQVRSDDYGDFTIPLQAGTVVRYEARNLGRELPFTLHVDVGGNEFCAAGEPWFRFRWPRGRR